MSDKSKHGVIIFSAFAVFGLIIFPIWGRMLKSDRDKNRVVVLACVFRVDKLGTDIDYECYYFYDNKKYTTSISFGDPRKLEVGTLLFSEISSKDPDNSNTLYKIKVPSCFSLDSMPSKGWKEIPTCDSIGTLP